MPVYIAHIFAWLRHRVVSPEVLRWAALAAAYAGVFIGYVLLLIALFDPRSAVMVARIIVLFAVFAGVSVLAVRFGRMWGERRDSRIEVVAVEVRS